MGYKVNPKVGEWNRVKDALAEVGGKDLGRLGWEMG